MKFQYLFLTIVLYSFTHVCTKAQSLPVPSAETQGKIQAVENNLGVPEQGKSSWTLKERMEYYKVKGVSIAVIHQYRIEWAKGYGWADEGSKTPVTPMTLFQAASISKSLNGVGILRLAQNHRVDLNTDINQYLTSWKFPYDSLSRNKKITLSHLLSHTAGLTVHGFDGYERRANIPSILQILDGKPPANSPAIRSMYEPGIRSEYSGGGITISQQIVMDVTHQPYAQYMYEQVLKPLGMTSSSYDQPYTNIDQSLLATGYDAHGDEIKGKYHIYPEQAPAGLWTNPTDLAKYIIDTQLSLEDKSKKVLNEKMTRLRLTPYLNKNAALGVFINDFNGIKYFQHGGANEGFRCQYYGSMEGGEGVVVMVNSDNGAIISEIISSVAKVYHLNGLNKTQQ